MSNQNNEYKRNIINAGLQSAENNLFREDLEYRKNKALGRDDAAKSSKQRRDEYQQEVEFYQDELKKLPKEEEEKK